MRSGLLCFFALLCLGCHRQQPAQESLINIHLSKDSQTIVLTGLDYSILQQLKQDSLTLENWQSIFPVYRMPADPEMADLQPEQPGKYQLTDSAIIFKPDTPFAKQQQYFTRFYGNTTNFSPGNLIRSKTNLKGQNFTEVRFKF